MNRIQPIEVEESEFFSTIVGGTRVGSAQEEVQQHVENFNGCVDGLKGSFKSKDVEKWFLEDKLELRQSPEYEFLEVAENVMVCSMVAVWVVTAVPSMNAFSMLMVPWLSIIYCFMVVSMITYWVIVKQVERYRMRDSSPVSLMVMECIALGYPCMISFSDCVASLDKIDEINENCLDTSFASMLLNCTALVLGAFLAITMLSPVRSYLHVRQCLVLSFLYLICASALLGLRNSVGATDFLAPLWCIFMMGNTARTYLAQATMSRMLWIIRDENSKARKVLLEFNLGFQNRGEKRRHNTRSTSEQNSFEHETAETKAFFKQLDENSGLIRLRIEMDDLTIKDYVGRGSEGEVYSALYMDAAVALKRLPLAMLTKNSCPAFISEVKLMKNLRHPNIVQLLGVCWDSEIELCGMIMELMTRGSLQSVLRDKKLTLSWEDPKCKLAIDIAKGMACIHSHNIVHRDLKTENVLVSSTFTGKITDFGQSKKLNTNGTLQVAAGTPFWRAPEMIRGEPYDVKADIYSFALILLEIATNESPFEDMNQLDALEFPHKVAQQNYRLPIPTKVPQQIRDIIEQCWQDDPAKRPAFILIRSRLQKFLSKISEAESDDSEKQISKLLLDQIIMSGSYDRINYLKGDAIILYGEKSEECFFVTKGEVDVFGPCADTEKVVDHEKYDWASVHGRPDPSIWRHIHTVCSGEYFGEFSMYAGTIRTATCVAKTDCTCIRFNRQTFVTKVDLEIQGLIASKIIKSLQNNPSKSNQSNGAPTNAAKPRLTKLEQSVFQRVDTMRNGNTFRPIGTSNNNDEEKGQAELRPGVPTTTTTFNNKM